MEHISRAFGILKKFHNTEIRGFAKFRVFPSFFDPVELLKRCASKNVMLPRHPSDQSNTFSNHGRAAYLTHGSLKMTSSTTSLTLIARDSTTELMLDQSSLFFESCQVLGDQNSTFFQIRRLPKAWLQILTFTLSTILSRMAEYY